MIFVVVVIVRFQISSILWLQQGITLDTTKFYDFCHCCYIRCRRHWHHCCHYHHHCDGGLWTWGPRENPSAPFFKADFASIILTFSSSPECRQLICDNSFAKQNFKKWKYCGPTDRQTDRHSELYYPLVRLWIKMITGAKLIILSF